MILLPLSVLVALISSPFIGYAKSTGGTHSAKIQQPLFFQYLVQSFRTIGDTARSFHSLMRGKQVNLGGYVCWGSWFW